jgi:hypothetical protein
MESLRNLMEEVLKKRADPRLTDACDFYPWTPKNRER